MNSPDAWIAVFSDISFRQNSLQPWTCPPTRLDARASSLGQSKQLYLISNPREWSPSVASTDAYQVVFDGSLSNRNELEETFSENLRVNNNDAQIVLQAYAKWGDSVVNKLKGVFAMLIRDNAKDTLLCTHDPLGMHPLFYSRTQHALIVSPSVHALLFHTDVPATLNRIVMTDYLSRRWQQVDKTCYSAIDRLPPGHSMWIRNGNLTLKRYWHPVPQDADIDWIPDDLVQERFDELLGSAVGRCLSQGNSGIYLSGGLDSAAIASVAADIGQQSQKDKPLGLSVAFPGAFNEQSVQCGVADGLGIEQIILDYKDAVGSRGILNAGLTLSGEMPNPLFNIWAPIFMRLSREAHDRGVRVMMSGEGGDDWLGASPYHATDLLRQGNISGIYRLCQSYTRFYPGVNWASPFGLVWHFGLRPFFKNTWQKLSSELRHGQDPTLITAEPWIAPDPELRRKINERNRQVDARANKSRLRGSYIQNLYSRLDDPYPCLRAEEVFYLGRSTGIRHIEPFWDPAIIEFLARVRPGALNRGQQTKALIRESLSRRFPELGFEKQTKHMLGELIRDVTAKEAPAAIHDMGKNWVLAELGLVDPKGLNLFLQNFQPSKGWRVWDVLNLEAWVRKHI